MWIFASAHSTSEPFIQILPVPGKGAAIQITPTGSLAHRFRPSRTNGRWLLLLLLITERTSIGAGVQWLAAVPAEPGCRGLAGPQPALDALRVVAAASSAPGGARDRAGLRCPRRAA